MTGSTPSRPAQTVESGFRRIQSPVTDDALAALSTRTVALGATGSGRVEHVPLEVYVARVLSGEGEPNAPDATQQALAVAIRTYTIFNIGRHARGIDVEFVNERLNDFFERHALAKEIPHARPGVIQLEDAVGWQMHEHGALAKMASNDVWIQANGRGGG